MHDDRLRIRFWGTRGSVPVSGADYRRYGGNTTCIEVRCGTEVLIFDAGSGLRDAGNALVKENLSKFDLFFTHFHYDHIIGLPFFRPIYRDQTSVRFWSGHTNGVMSTKEMISRFMRPPWFPVDPEICKASLNTMDFKAGDVLEPRKGVSVRTIPLNHPDGCMGYRVDWSGRSVALLFDTEHEPGILDPKLLDFIAGVDLLIYDSTYLDSEMAAYRGYGHSTGLHGAALARSAGVGRLAMVHHDPDRTDPEIDAMEETVQAIMPGAFAALEGQIIDL